MSIVLTKQCEELITRLINSGRYSDVDDVVRAGLQKLEAEERSSPPEVFPPGSLKHVYTEDANREELKTLGGLYLNVEPE